MDILVGFFVLNCWADLRIFEKDMEMSVETIEILQGSFADI